ncbi:hypothetical protein FOZ62_008160, partial [Perkinsus olseni]
LAAADDRPSTGMAPQRTEEQPSSPAPPDDEAPVASTNGVLTHLELPVAETNTVQPPEESAAVDFPTALPQLISSQPGRDELPIEVVLSRLLLAQAYRTIVECSHDELP